MGEKHERIAHRHGADVEAVMAATRILVAISAQSVAAVDDLVTLPQLRVLVMLASRGPLNLSTVARGLGVHPSNATRACDRLVAADLVTRREDPADRRNLLLGLSDKGHGLVETVMNQRRAAIAAVLGRMPPVQRAALVPVLEAFSAAAGGVDDGELWAAGWTSAPPPEGDERPR